MSYLVDGHNLIPKIAGLSLQDMDDEMQLIQLLQEFCRLQRKDMEVFFDKAPVGQDGARRFGRLTAHFVRAGTTADSAIMRRLAQLGRSASTWTVVSSDRSVQAAARSHHAGVISSDAFARTLMGASKGSKPGAPDQKRAEACLDSQEVDEWLKLFGGDKE